MFCVCDDISFDLGMNLFGGIVAFILFSLKCSTDAEIYGPALTEVSDLQFVALAERIFFNCKFLANF